MATVSIAREAAATALASGLESSVAEVSSFQRAERDTKPKYLLNADLRNRYRRPEAQLTLYKTGYVPNINTKDTTRITRRARFTTQDHLLTYPVYKSAYENFSANHPAMVKVTAGAMKRADSIPPLRVTLDFKDRATKRVLKTADIWVPALKSTEVKHLRQPFDSLIHAVDSAFQYAVKNPTSEGLRRVRRVFEVLGNKIQSVALPILPQRIRRQLEKNPPINPAVLNVISTSTAKVKEILTQQLYEEQYQLLSRILQKDASVECNLCDLVKYLFVRSGKDGDQGKKLHELIAAWGADADNIVNPDCIVSAAAEATKESRKVSSTKSKESVGNQSDIQKDTKRKRSRVSSRSSKTTNKAAEKVASEHLDPQMDILGTTFTDATDGSQQIEKGLDEVSSFLSIFLQESVLSVAMDDSGVSSRESEKQQKSVRFSEAGTTASVDHIEETATISTQGHEVGLVSYEEVSYLAQIASRDFDPQSKDFSEYAYQITELLPNGDNSSSLISSALFSIQT